MSVNRARQGGWIARWRDENGRDRSRNFRFKRDAVKFDEERKRRKQLGPILVAQLTKGGWTLDRWVVERWGPEHAANLEQSTRDRYADVYRLYIEPVLGNFPLLELTVRRLREWQADLVADGVGAGTIEKARTVLSSILSHAAEADEIPANPLPNVRAPKQEHRDGVRPLSPLTVEIVRTIIAGPMDSVVPERSRRGRKVSGYVIPDERTTLTRLRDATIVSMLSYLGERPGELRGQRWSDILTKTILIERATDPDGTLKSTKTGERRATRLLSILYEDLERYYIACGSPSLDSLILPGVDDEHGWTKSNWQTWRARHWGKACKLAGLTPVPRPYDLRHSSVSLMLAEGHRLHYIAKQHGTSERLILETYGHLFDEYEGADPIDAEAEIRAARTEVAKLVEAAGSSTGVCGMCADQGRRHSRFLTGQRESPAFAGLSLISTPNGS